MDYTYMKKIIEMELNKVHNTLSDRYPFSSESICAEGSEGSLFPAVGYMRLIVIIMIDTIHRNNTNAHVVILLTNSITKVSSR